jgi:hypothetical protein
MGKSRHDGRRVAFRLINERRLQPLCFAIDPVDGLAHPEFEIHRHLIVARAGGMQTAGRRADRPINSASRASTLR